MDTKALDTPTLSAMSCMVTDLPAFMSCRLRSCP
jgi:hypothetical protein